MALHQESTHSVLLHLRRILINALIRFRPVIVSCIIPDAVLCLCPWSSRDEMWGRSLHLGTPDSFPIFIARRIHTTFGIERRFPSRFLKYGMRNQKAASIGI